MIIDAHTHLGRNKHIEATADELVRSMDKAGIEKSFVLAGRMNDCPNEWMLEQIAPHKDRLVGIAAAHPTLYKVMNDFYPIYGKEYQEALQSEKEELKKITDWYGEGKIIACKFYVGYDHYYPSDMRHYLSTLDKLGCPAIFHSGDCLNTCTGSKLKYAHPLHIDDVAVDYPNMNFIIAHMGFPWIRDAAEVCYKNSNVYSDFSGFVYGEFAGADTRKFSNAVNSFLDIAGNEKLLFGTDWPISDQKSYLRTNETLFEQSLCPAPEYLTKNTMRAYKCEKE